MNLADMIKTVADSFTLYAVLWILLGAGVFFTVVTRGVQFRFFSHMWRVVLESRQGAEGGISSFQAFTISLAARVGVGNVFGVAAAIMLGGPGAIFWMWIVALVGMATSFVESTLAQIYKVPQKDGTFRGGPAYYMWLGLKARWFGALFAIIAIVTCGFVITSVQSNAMAMTIFSALPESVQLAPYTKYAIALFLFLLAAPVILGGIRSVARVTEIMAPVMAIVYVLLALVVILINIRAVPSLLMYIVSSAFTGEAVGGGIGAGILAAIINGTQRGLFSNEAGQGTAPNAAATATVSHPVKQGLIQSLGVFVDTIIVCTATAIIILSSNASFWGIKELNPANMTTLAIGRHLGYATQIFMVALIVVLAFSSVIAAYVYSDVNMAFVTKHPVASWIVRLVCNFSVAIGALAELPLVWNAVDIAMGIMTITNLIALIFLWKWVVGALKDYSAQLKSGVEDPVFVATDNPYLPGELPTKVWEAK